MNFYRNYFSELKKAKVRLVVNLFHFDIPIEFLKQKGFENKQIIEKYVEYAKVCFDNFNDLVDDWATFNEPMANVDSQYLNGHHYPKEKNLYKSVQVFYNMMVAHAKVVNLFNKNYKKLNQKITIIISLNPAQVRDKNNPLDVLAANKCDLLVNFSQLDPVLNGKFDSQLISILKEENLLPIYNQNELNEIANAKIDYISLNYYQPIRVKEIKKNSNHIMSKFFDFYDWPEKRINPSRGWEIYPKAIYDIAIIIKNKYNNVAWIISENGIGVQNEDQFRDKNNEINDQYRIDFISEHLEGLQKAISEGANCFGYSLWTFIDCWSWSNAYKNRYGLIEYNLENDKFINKKSSYEFKKLIESK
ncbi:glycoside hydrolase family 1 protein [Spiroplasma taiwanense]|uniref:glycoside hydrolase family 1 protein n=1 Tax=Spiroplasma taiwanense TaxID=2145 RepID=UPI00191C3C48|nr:glycoside hydrolase family 1 protein [Spiroplasma taiwanense]